MLTAEWLFERRAAGARLTVVTPERAPLAALGARASDMVAALLDRHGVQTRLAVSPRAVREGTLVLGAGQSVAAERVVALARLVGPALPGLPADAEWVRASRCAWPVPGAADVYAGGDVTTWAMKQGGVAAQQADAVAETLAAWAGAPVRPTAFQPVVARRAAHGEAAGLPACRRAAAPHPFDCAADAVVVATGEGRRPLSGPVSRRARHRGARGR